jgi:hypothetical protein
MSSLFQRYAFVDITMPINLEDEKINLVEEDSQPINLEDEQTLRLGEDEATQPSWSEDEQTLRIEDEATEPGSWSEDEQTLRIEDEATEPGSWSEDEATQPMWPEDEATQPRWPEDEDTRASMPMAMSFADSLSDAPPGTYNFPVHDSLTFDDDAPSSPEVTLTESEITSPIAETSSTSDPKKKKFTIQVVKREFKMFADTSEEEEGKTATKTPTKPVSKRITSEQKEKKKRIPATAGFASSATQAGVVYVSVV